MAARHLHRGWNRGYQVRESWSGDPLQEAGQGSIGKPTKNLFQRGAQSQFINRLSFLEDVSSRNEKVVGRKDGRVAIVSNTGKPHTKREA